MDEPVRILVVEDEPDIQNLIKTALRFTGGYDVLLASNGQEAIEKAQQEQPDLILMDVMMPKMDGFQALRHLQEHPETQNIPVIMLTAKAQRQEVETGLRAGAKGYITKPFDPMQLKAQIEAILSSAESRPGEH